MKRYIVIAVVITATGLHAMDKQAVVFDLAGKPSFVDVKAGLFTSAQREHDEAVSKEELHDFLGDMGNTSRLTKAQALDVVLARYGVFSLASRDEIIERMSLKTYEKLQDAAIALQRRKRRSRRDEPAVVALRLLIKEMDASSEIQRKTLIEQIRQTEEQVRQTEEQRLQTGEQKRQTKLQEQQREGAQEALRLQRIALWLSIAGGIAVSVVSNIINYEISH